MDYPLTRRQIRVLDIIVDCIAERGYQPSIRQLMARLKIKSPNGIVCRLTALEKKGYIRRNKIAARSLLINWEKYRCIRPGNSYETAKRIRGAMKASQMFLAAMEGR